MLSAAAARRTSSGLPRHPRTPAISRSIAFSAHPRPLRNLPVSKASSLYTRPQYPSPLVHRHVLNSFNQTRSLSYFQRTRLGLRQASKGIWRKNPVLLPLAILSAVGASLFLAYIAYIEVTENGPRYRAFPPSVEGPLRQAVYFSDVAPDPKKALRYYQQAYKAAIEGGMHAFSDECIGIKLKVVDMLEGAGQVDQAIKVLEDTSDRILKWVEDGRNKVAAKQQVLESHEKQIEKQQGDKKKAQAEDTYPMKPTLDTNNPEVLADYDALKEFEEWEEQQRNKGIRKAVGIHTKLSDLYAGDHMQDPKKSEAALEKAVEIAMKELNYRESHSLSMEGGISGDGQKRAAWLTRQEVAVTLADLGQHYSERGMQELAIPLFLRSLSLFKSEDGPGTSCIMVQIMLITAVSCSQAGETSSPDVTEEHLRARLRFISFAENMTRSASELYKETPEDEIDDQCRSCFIHAKHMLSIFARMRESPKEAKSHLDEALAKSKELARRSNQDPHNLPFWDDLEDEYKRITEEQSKK